MMNWRKAAFELYLALDDIDTADDLAKGDEALYRNLTREAHKRRFSILGEETADDLYEEFWTSEDGLMPRNLNAIRNKHIGGARND